MEKVRPVEFLFKFFFFFFPDLLGTKNFHKPIDTEHALHIGDNHQEGSAHPWVMIARIHYCQLREKILLLA